jgi:hypothetical protein
MSSEQPQQSSAPETEELAETKTDEEREHEEQWSQGGQDVEEEQHSEPQAEQ